MKLHFTAIPALDPMAAQADLNRFLGSHRVVHVERELITDGAQSFWAICVTYTDSPGKTAPTRSKKSIDYRELLSDTEFRAFSALRTRRKQLADANGVPAYAVFTRPTQCIPSSAAYR